MRDEYELDATEVQTLACAILAGCLELAVMVPECGEVSEERFSITGSEIAGFLKLESVNYQTSDQARKVLHKYDQEPDSFWFQAHEFVPGLVTSFECAQGSYFVITFSEDVLKECLTAAGIVQVARLRGENEVSRFIRIINTFFSDIVLLGPSSLT